MCGFVDVSLKIEAWNKNFPYCNSVHYLIVSVSILVNIPKNISAEWEVGHINILFLWMKRKIWVIFFLLLLRSVSICMHSSLIFFYFYDFICCVWYGQMWKFIIYTANIHKNASAHTRVPSLALPLSLSLFLLQPSKHVYYIYPAQTIPNSFHFIFGFYYCRFFVRFIYDILCWQGLVLARAQRTPPMPMTNVCT